MNEWNTLVSSKHDEVNVNSRLTSAVCFMCALLFLPRDVPDTDEGWCKQTTVITFFSAHRLPSFGFFVCLSTILSYLCFCVSARLTWNWTNCSTEANVLLNLGTCDQIIFYNSPWNAATTAIDTVKVKNVLAYWRTWRCCVGDCSECRWHLFVD